MTKADKTTQLANQPVSSADTAAIVGQTPESATSAGGAAQTPSGAASQPATGTAPQGTPTTPAKGKKGRIAKGPRGDIGGRRLMANTISGLTGNLIASKLARIGQLGQAFSHLGGMAESEIHRTMMGGASNKKGRAGGQSSNPMAGLFSQGGMADILNESSGSSGGGNSGESTSILEAILETLKELVEIMKPKHEQLKATDPNTGNHNTLTKEQHAGPPASQPGQGTTNINSSSADQIRSQVETVARVQTGLKMGEALATLSSGS